MRTKLTVATAIVGSMLVTCLISGSAQATSVPVLKSDATPGIVMLVGHGGGHGGGGRPYGGGGGKHYGGGGGKHYAYKGGDHDYYDHHKRYGYYGGHRRYGYYGWYGLPYISYGYYGGGCGWLYRNALATGSPYWWNRYYECTGYY